MDEHTLADQFTSVFFCFRYDRDAVDCNRLHVPFVKSNGREIELWRPEKLHTYHLKVHASDMLTGEGKDGTVGRLYTLDDGVRRDLDLPDARTQAELLCRSGARVPLRLDAVRLALFRTGIGILELSFVCSGGSDAVLEANYFLSEVKSDANRLVFTRRLGKDQSVEKSVRLIELVEKLLAPLGGVQDFDTRDGLRFIDNKPLVFTYLLFDRFPDDLGRTLFGLRTNFKSSYKVPEAELDPDGGRSAYHPFENLYWGFSLNGVACCAALTGDEETDRFFRETFPHNLHCTYKYLYLLRLHQRFMIQDLEDRFSAAGAALSAAADAEVEGVYRAAEALKGEAALFRLQSFFREPASVEHINRFDAALAEDLGIEQSYERLRGSILLLEQLSAAARERIRTREQTVETIRSLKRERIIYLATALWGMVLLFQNACQILDRFTGATIALGDPLILIPAVIAVAPAVKLLFDFRARGAQIRRLESSLQGPPPAAERKESQ